jgi:hypothetical protein
MAPESPVPADDDVALLALDDDLFLKNTNTTIPSARPPISHQRYFRKNGPENIFSFASLRSLAGAIGVAGGI